MAQEARMFTIRGHNELLADDRLIEDPAGETPTRWLRLVQFALTQRRFAAVTIPARWARYVADAHTSHGYVVRVTASASPEMRLLCVWHPRHAAQRAQASA